MSFFDDLEETHSSLKQFGLENVDPSELRVLLRKAQVLATLFESHEVISFQLVDVGWEVTLVSNVGRDTKFSLIHMLEE